MFFVVQLFNSVTQYSVCSFDPRDTMGFKEKSRSYVSITKLSEVTAKLPIAALIALYKANQLESVKQ